MRPARGAQTRENGMLKEFREFAVKGNVVDLAIGVIIGAAFGKIVESIVKDIFMPIVGRILGGLNFDNYFIGLTDAASKATNYADAQKAGATLGYGAFITVTINFLIIAWILFLVVKGINRLRRQEAAAEPEAKPEDPADIKLLTEIRDLLKKP
jgi:large conductance mechanosensitive channel